MWQAFVIFLLDALIDWVWAKYNIACAERKPIAAGVFAVAIILMSSFSLLMFVHNQWLIVPGAAGACIGTYIAVKQQA